MLLSASEASAASRVWITEFATLGATPTSGMPAQVAMLPAILTQPLLDISGGVQSSQAFNVNTKLIRVICEVQCAIKVGGTATTSDTPLIALQPEYFGISSTAPLSVIADP